MLYRLERTGKVLIGEVQRQIVRAAQEVVAREWASKCCGKEGPEPWKTRAGSTIEVIDEMGLPAIIDSVTVW